MQSTKDIRMFCETCKSFPGNSKANYCAECGSRLLDTLNLLLPAEELNTRLLREFLISKLGCTNVEEIDASSICVRWSPHRDRQSHNRPFDELLITVLEDTLVLHSYSPLIKDINGDLDFFKALNRANSVCGVRFVYEAPTLNTSSIGPTDCNQSNGYFDTDDCNEDESEYGDLKVWYVIPYASYFPLKHLYKLAQSSFECCGAQICTDYGLLPYLKEVFKVIRGPLFIKDMGRIVQVVESTERGQEIHVFENGTFRSIDEDDDISWSDLENAIPIPLDVFF